MSTYIIIRNQNHFNLNFPFIVFCWLLYMAVFVLNLHLVNDNLLTHQQQPEISRQESPGNSYDLPGTALGATGSPDVLGVNYRVGKVVRHNSVPPQVTRAAISPPFSVKKYFKRRPSWFLFDTRFAHRYLYVYDKWSWSKHKLTTFQVWNLKDWCKTLKPVKLPGHRHKPFGLSKVPVYRYH